jgi:hypothetical protein
VRWIITVDGTKVLQHADFMAFSDYPQDEIKATVYFTASRNKLGPT